MAAVLCSFSMFISVFFFNNHSSAHLARTNDCSSYESTFRPSGNDDDGMNFWHVFFLFVSTVESFFIRCEKDSTVETKRKNTCQKFIPSSSLPEGRKVDSYDEQSFVLARCADE